MAPDSPTSTAPIRAAAYARMSTTMQRYSIENQLAAISLYAEDNEFELIQSYVDAGKSGLRLQNRAGLRQLLEDVVSGRAEYQALLVYDVSRWGRFQDTDESAHYEWLCRSNGIRVIYCAEQFSNDGSPFATLLKGIKRTMAAEFSRELSVKISTARIRVAKRGFNVGAPTPFGLRRLMVDEHRQPITLLEAQQFKSITGARVVLVRGPPAEVTLVRRMFHLFLYGDLSFSAIARTLNAEGIPSPRGSIWTGGRVAILLQSECYAGHSVYNRISNPLRAGPTPNPPDCWVRVEAAIEPVIDQNTFNRVQKKIASAAWRRGNEELLNRFRAYLKTHKELSVTALNTEKGLPNYALVRRRFGSLQAVNQLLGQPTRYRPYRSVNFKRLRSFRHQLIRCLLAASEQAGVAATPGLRHSTLKINGQTVLLILTAVEIGPDGRERCPIKLKAEISADIVLVARLGLAAPDPTDYYLFPRTALTASRFFLPVDATHPIQIYRLPTLDAVCDQLNRPGGFDCPTPAADAQRIFASGVPAGDVCQPYSHGKESRPTKLGDAP